MADADSDQAQGPKPTEERILGAVTAIYRQGEAQVKAFSDLTGRVDRLAGAVDEQRQIISDLLLAMPKPVRYCPRWVDEDTAVIHCEGGVQLMRSTFSDGSQGGKKEWTHPLRDDEQFETTLDTGGTVLVKWHNVYESKALSEPPGGVERPWPEQDAGGGNTGGDDRGPPREEPDDSGLPF